MKKLALLVCSLLTAGCGENGFKLGFPPQEISKPQPPASTSRPATGCTRDVTVNYTNNCSKELVMYFIEMSPGDSMPCESAKDEGVIQAGGSKSITVHSGKIGFVIFAEDAEGRCTTSHRKAESWVHCEQATGNIANFNICR